MRCVTEYDCILATKKTRLIDSSTPPNDACDENSLLCILYIFFQFSVYSNMKFNFSHRRTFTCALNRFLNAPHFTNEKRNKKSILHAAQLSTGCALRCTWIRMSTQTNNRENISRSQNICAFCSIFMKKYIFF